MFFHIEHTTEYVYTEPATESFSELRLRPRDSLRQHVSHHSTLVQPAVPAESYTDYFGNFVETISIPFRHTSLVVKSVCLVQTLPLFDALSGLDLTISEARHLFAPRRRELFDFLQPSFFVSFTPEIEEMTRALLPPRADFAVSLKNLNHYIFKTFDYAHGVTDARTRVADFLKVKRGVCQDFAHLMISLCRCAGIPARYVSGYIESEILSPGKESAAAEPALIGHAASHAWVEVFSPNGFWVGLDPTNDIMEGERHVQIGIGRDYHDVPPMQGVFKGRRQQSLSVKVRVMRTELTPDERPATMSA